MKASKFNYIRLAGRISWLLALAGTLLLNACGNDEGKNQVQRVVVRPTSYTTPQPKASPKSSPSPKASPAPKSSPVEMKKPSKKPTQARSSTSAGPVASKPTSALSTPRSSAGARQAPPVVTTHTLSLILPDKPVSFEVQGQRLANCRIYLRRYGSETELNPTRRSDNLLEFESQHLGFVESGDYDLVVRGSDGSEWTFAGAAHVK